MPQTVLLATGEPMSARAIFMQNMFRSYGYLKSPSTPRRNRFTLVSRERPVRPDQLLRLASERPQRLAVNNLAQTSTDGDFESKPRPKPLRTTSVLAAAQTKLPVSNPPTYSSPISPSPPLKQSN